MQRLAYFQIWALLIVGYELLMALPAVALPPPEDIPEEVLRTEIITEARSPVDGRPLSAAEYAELQAQLETPGQPPSVPSNIRQLIFLLQIRRTFLQFFPFFPH
jgi:hypothetical protein